MTRVLPWPYRLAIIALVPPAVVAALVVLAGVAAVWAGEEVLAPLDDEEPAFDTEAGVEIDG